MHIDWWTLGLQAVNVLILVWLLGRFLFRPVADIIAARQAEVDVRLADAAKAAADAGADRRRAADELAKAAATRADALSAAAADAAMEKSALLAEAQADGERLRAEARADVERARREEAQSADDRAAMLAVDIAEKLIARLPEIARTIGFDDELSAQIAALPAPTLAAVRSDGAQFLLRAPRALSDAALGAVRDKLSAAIGAPAQVSVEVDPGVIAGFELTAPHVVVRNNLKADLERISAELTRHGHV